jgi:3-hydroxybutyryl-CoA dehydrogenase
MDLTLHKSSTSIVPFRREIGLVEKMALYGDTDICYYLYNMHQIKTICVCGAGTMGSGIAQLCAQKGYQTLLFDLNDAALQKAKDAIAANWTSLVQKQKISTEEQITFDKNLRYSSNMSDCMADLVIEAIIEKLAAKLDLFLQLAELNPLNTLFVSNTSSISINTIANKLPDPFRFAGMHFFNPATRMQLVELVKGDQTSDAMLYILEDLVVKLGKTAVVCKDSPGFIVNRVARHYYLESLWMVEQGLAEVETIDAVLEATGFKMGAFKLMDLIGIDINYSVSQTIWEDLGQPTRLSPSKIYVEKLLQNCLGMKSKIGFYSYK